MLYTTANGANEKPRFLERKKDIWTAGSSRQKQSLGKGHRNGKLLHRRLISCHKIPRLVHPKMPTPPRQRSQVRSGLGQDFRPLCRFLPLADCLELHHPPLQLQHLQHCHPGCQPSTKRAIAKRKRRPTWLPCWRAKRLKKIRPIKVEAEVEEEVIVS